jgi:DNA-binding CsgD family transcriptional regulator
MQEQIWDMDNKFFIKPRIITPKKQILTDDEIKTRLIENLTKIGLTDTSIARIFKISPKTISRVRKKLAR